ncbi:MAG: class I SAM-dependent methyltransferase [Acidobacteriota bacterium]
MAHRFDPANVHKLESEERRRLPPQEILQRVGLGEGMVFADVGAGAGFFTLPAAGLVGASGKVYALDVSEEMLAHLRAKTLPPQVEVLLCGEESLPLPGACCDLVFSAFVLHEVPRPAAFLRELGRVAKPRAAVVVLDWRPIEEEEGPPLEERIAPEKAEGLFAAAGLSIGGTESVGGSFYLVRGFREVLP